MSRVYRITVAESVTRIVHVEDGVEAPIELLPILAPERMADLLAAELAEKGFQRDGNRLTRVDPDGTTIEIDLTASTVSVKLASTSEVNEELSTTRTVVDDSAAGRDRAKADLRRELEGRIDERATELRKEVTAALEGRLADVRAEIDAAVGSATLAALTEKAGQLGSIESLTTDDAGNVTIKVRL
jgi:hypothetical protein